MLRKTLFATYLSIFFAVAAAAQIGFPFPGPGVAATGKTLSLLGSESRGTTCVSPCSYDNGGSHYNVAAGYVHVFAFAQGATTSISSIAICGSTATTNVTTTPTGTTGAWGTIAMSANPTCNIQVTYGVNPTRSGVVVYNSTGLASATSPSTGVNSACAAFPTACATAATTTKVAGGFTLAGAVNQNCTSNSWSVPSVRDFFVNVGAGAICASTASSSSNSAGAQTGSYTDSSGSLGGIAVAEF